MVGDPVYGYNLVIQVSLLPCRTFAVRSRGSTNAKSMYAAPDSTGTFG